MSVLANSSLVALEESGALETTRLSERRARMRRMRFDTVAVHGVYDMEEALRTRARSSSRCTRGRPSISCRATP